MGNGDDAGTYEEVVVWDMPKGGGGTIDRPSLIEKDMYQDLADELNAGAIGFGAFAGVCGFAGPEAWGAGLVAILIAAGCGLTAIGCERIARDPAQLDYKKKVVITPFHIDLPDSIIIDNPDVHRMIRCFGEIVPLTNGVLDSFERHQGAALNNDDKWVAAHSSGADIIIACLVTRIKQFANSLGNISKSPQLDVAVNTTTLVEYCRSAKTDGFIPELLRGKLLDAGITETDLNDYKSLIADFDTNSLTGSLSDIFLSIANNLSEYADKIAALW